MSRAGVLGSPIAHSLSPVLHRAAYQAMGLADWTYDAIECREDEFAAKLSGFDASWAGLSLTMPLKRVALPLLGSVSDLALAVGAANTVIWRDEAGERRSRGENTDVYGMVTALEEAGVKAASAVILGGGATAASGLAALRELGIGAATLAVRSTARAAEAQAAAERLGIAVTLQSIEEPFPATDLVISALPGRAADAYAERVAGLGAAVLDVMYSPWPTRLAHAVRSAGGSVVGGFPMLLHQAAKQVELMTGRSGIPVEAMRTAGERALDS